MKSMLRFQITFKGLLIKGGLVEMFFLIVFALGVLFLVWSMVGTHKACQKEAEIAMQAALDCGLRFIELDTLINANIKSMKAAMDKVHHFDSGLNRLDTICLNQNERLLNLNNKQMELQDKISIKRPIVKVLLPAEAVKISGGKGIKSLIRESVKKSKTLERKK